MIEIPFPDKKYQVIYADPPWSYSNKKTGDTNMISGAIDKYPTMTLNEIKTLPVQDICEKNCVLFLWGTTPLLPEAFEVLSSWGFKYKTTLYWRKIMSLGMGFWFRGQVEVCLVGIKGKVKAFRIQKANFIQTKVGKHSEKPIEVRQLIELTKLDPKIELFARQKTKDWDYWGNEVLEISKQVISTETKQKTIF